MAGPAPTPPAWAEAAARVAAAGAGESAAAGGEQGKGRAGRAALEGGRARAGRGGARQALAGGGRAAVRRSSPPGSPRESGARARGQPGSSRGRLGLPSGSPSTALEVSSAASCLQLPRFPMLFRLLRGLPRGLVSAASSVSSAALDAAAAAAAAATAALCIVGAGGGCARAWPRRLLPALSGSRCLPSAAGTEHHQPTRLTSQTLLGGVPRDRERGTVRERHPRHPREGLQWQVLLRVSARTREFESYSPQAQLFLGRRLRVGKGSWKASL